MASALFLSLAKRVLLSLTPDMGRGSALINTPISMGRGSLSILNSPIHGARLRSH